MATKQWVRAQKKEIDSWLNTDMTSKKLTDLWQKRKSDFAVLFKELKPKSAILDVGSGPISALHIFPRTKCMVALDPLNDKYKTKYQRKPYIKYVSAQAEKLKFKDKAFDMITCINALDHMENHNNVLKEMIRCLKPGGIIYLEYENTSPLSLLLARLGYKKPLNDFHPVLIQNSRLLKLFKSNHFTIITTKYKPQLSKEKITGIISVILGKKKISSYEKKISVINYGYSKAISHYLIISLELLLFWINPSRFTYFTTLIVKKKKS